MLVGIILVLCLFAFFLFLVGIVHRSVRVQKHTFANEAQVFAAFCILHFSTNNVLFVDGFEDLSMVMIIVRSIYRVAEFSGGFQNPISTNEELFYLCDCLPLLLFMAVWIVFHPIRVPFEFNNETIQFSDRAQKAVP